MTRPLRAIDGPGRSAAEIARAHVHPPANEGAAEAPRDRPEIRIGNGPETIRTLAAHLDSQVIPDTYVSAGRFIAIETVSGTARAAVADEDSPLPVSATPVSPPLLARLLAEHAYVFKMQKPTGSDELVPVETTPPAAALAAVLAAKSWPGLPPLLGVVGSPVLRPDGTLLQRPGYDGKTGLYLASKVPLDPIPDRPSSGEVREARRFLLEVFLRDFPWVSEADRANYLGLMVTPILRPYTRALAPFGVVTATMPGSGKTILTAAIGMSYGQRVLSWTHSDEELRKSITSVLADKVGVVVWDNLVEGAVIDSPILARLITEREWSDRGLGGNTTLSMPNDRLWLATGNALNVGGDMASRTVLVRLDPDMPNPETRTDFAIDHLDSWILQPANQRTVLRHLLVLILDWTAAGAPRAQGFTMRQFSGWAQNVGGFLAHHGVPGFLANAGAVEQVDEAAAEWGAFLARWHQLYGSDAKTAAELRASAEPKPVAWPERPVDPWEGAFFTDIKGHPISTKALGVRLRGQVGRWRGHYVLRKGHDPARNSGVYWVEVQGR